MNDDAEFRIVGALQPYEARNIFEKLISLKIRFKFDEGDDKSLGNCVLTKTDLPSWVKPPGKQANIILYVHEADEEAFRALLLELYKI